MIGSAFAKKKVQLVADPRFFAERPKMRTRHIKLC
jgi:hypothetical protein